MAGAVVDGHPEACRSGRSRRFRGIDVLGRAPGGAVAWTSVLEITVKLRAFLEPKATLVVPSKALPKIVTTLPAGPADGFKRNASGDAVSEVTEAVSVDAPCVTS